MSGHARSLRLAGEQLARGQVDAAIETLAQRLGEAPDDADAHALLALCLVRRKRLHAARLEADAALRLEPENGFAHSAMAAALIASRRFGEAREHLHQARALDPEDADVEMALARLYLLWDRVADARRHADRACALAPDDTGARVVAAEVARAQGDLAQAAALARDVLAEDPESVDALVILGHAALASGDVESALAHAAWALRQNPEDEGALTLLCAVKARRSLWLGLWWRFQTFVMAGGTTRAIVLLLGLFVAYRVAEILLGGAGRQDIADVLRIAWLGFCVYTWVGPAVFIRAVRRELEQVRLRPEF